MSDRACGACGSPLFWKRPRFYCDRKCMADAMRAAPKKPAVERFWEFVSPEPNTGCWLWTGGTNRGYGMFSWNGRTRVAYRFAFEALRGPIPPGMSLDHLCRTQLCVNPSHLDPCSRSENSRRSQLFRPRATHCGRGHPMSGANLGKHNNSRRCLACHALRMKGKRYGLVQIH